MNFHNLSIALNALHKAKNLGGSIYTKVEALLNAEATTENILLIQKLLDTIKDKSEYFTY